MHVEDAAVRQAGALLLGLAARTALSASPGLAADLESLLSHSAVGTSAGERFLLRFSTVDIDTLITSGRPLLAHDAGRYQTEERLHEGGSMASGAQRLAPAQSLLLKRRDVLRVLGLSTSASEAVRERGRSTLPREVTTALAVTNFSELMDEADLTSEVHRNQSILSSTAVDVRQLLLPGKGKASRGGGGGSHGGSDPQPAPAEHSAGSSDSPLSALADCYHEISWLAFHSDWYVRHGAILSLHALLVGIRQGRQDAPAQQDGLEDSQASLTTACSPVVEDAVLRCIAVLALDRVDDYSGCTLEHRHASQPMQAANKATKAGVANQADSLRELVQCLEHSPVAPFAMRSPVRCAAAAVLSEALQAMSPDTILQVLGATILPKLAGATDWHCHHGAALAYCVWLPRVTALPSRLLSAALTCAFTVTALMTSERALRPAGGASGLDIDTAGTAVNDEVSAVAASCVASLLRSPPWHTAGLLDADRIVLACAHLLAGAADPGSSSTGSIIACALSAMNASAAAPVPVPTVVKLGVTCAGTVRHPDPHVRLQSLQLLLQCLKRAASHMEEAENPVLAGVVASPALAYMRLLSIASGTACALLEQDRAVTVTMPGHEGSQLLVLGAKEELEDLDIESGLPVGRIVLDASQPLLRWSQWVSGQMQGIPRPFLGAIETLSLDLVAYASSVGPTLPVQHTHWLAHSWLPSLFSILSTRDGDAITDDMITAPVHTLPAALHAGTGDRALEMTASKQALSREACPMGLHKRALGCAVAACVVSQVLAPMDSATVAAAHLQAAQQQDSESLVTLASLLTMKVAGLTVAHASAVHNVCLAPIASLFSRWRDNSTALACAEVRPFLRDLQAACADLHACMVSASIPVRLAGPIADTEPKLQSGAMGAGQSGRRRREGGKQTDAVDDVDSVLSALLSFDSLLPTADALLAAVKPAVDDISGEYSELAQGTAPASTRAHAGGKRRKVQHIVGASAGRAQQDALPSDLQLHASRVSGLSDALRSRAHAVARKARGLLAAAELAPLCTAYRLQHAAASLLPLKLTGAIKSLLDLAGAPCEDDAAPCTDMLRALSCERLATFTAWCLSCNDDKESTAQSQLDVSKIGQKLLCDLIPALTPPVAAPSASVPAGDQMTCAQAQPGPPVPHVGGDYGGAAVRRLSFMILSLSSASSRHPSVEQQLLSRLQAVCGADMSHSSCEGLMYRATACCALLASLHALDVQAAGNADSSVEPSARLTFVRQQLHPLLTSVQSLSGAASSLSTSSGLVTALSLALQAYMTHDLYYTLQTLLPILEAAWTAASSTNSAATSVILAAVGDFFSCTQYLISVDTQYLISVAPGVPPVPLHALPLRTVCGVFVPLIVSSLNNRESIMRASAMRALRAVVRHMTLLSVIHDAPDGNQAEPLELQRAAQQGLDVLDMLNSSARVAWSRLPLSVCDAFKESGGAGTEGGGHPAGPQPRAAASTMPVIRLPFSVNVPLRSYQLHGIAWLTALCRYNLCGILADDMGLGKTVQVLCALAVWAQEGSLRAQHRPLVSIVSCPSSLVQHWKLEFERYFTGTAVSSLIRPVPVDGPAQQRTATIKAAMLQTESQHHTLLIVSHATLRMDYGEIVSALSSSSSASSSAPAPLPGGQQALAWFILDESHVCSNASSALHHAVCSVSSLAAHRVALTGTPVSNSVGDIWSTFHWLMPAYLGDRQSFEKSIAKPVLKARSTQATMADAAAARSSLRQLHSCLLPFVLRRTKGEVLRELPQKTIVDMPLPLVPAQRAMYDAFVAASGTQWAQAAIRALETEESEQVLGEASGADAGSGGTTVALPAKSAAKVEAVSIPVSTFTAITTLRQICSHPALVTDGSLLARHVASGSKGTKEGQYPMQQSCKLLALHSLLQQLGIVPAAEPEPDLADGRHTGKRGGTKTRASTTQHGEAAAAQSSESEEDDSNPLLSLVHEKKALIFAQSTRMLDAVEEGVLKPCWFDRERGSHRSSSSKDTATVAKPWLRIDGSTPAGSRAGIAALFGSEPSLRLLLLTTGAAGLGLNLVAADTVIFLEHDWNPTRDLQAMDRAHRLGQTRPVTVYRLLAQDTLEERIMGLQRFKMSVSNAVLGPSQAGTQRMPGTTGALQQLAGLSSTSL